ncbi:MAG: ABC transporter permease [Clostridiales bacterium]|nr:ABC transporter permease [Clostridiales bacterium]
MKEKRIGRIGQTKVYLGKCLRLFVSEKQWISFVSTAIIMFIILQVTDSDMFRDYSSTKNGAFAIICACVWIGLFNSIRSICKERAIIKREHRTGLHISSYILAHVLYELMICAAESFLIILFVVIRYHTNLTFAGLLFPMVCDLYLTFFLVTFGSDMLAILIS